MITTWTPRMKQFITFDAFEKMLEDATFTRGLDLLVLFVLLTEYYNKLETKQ
jgi:hypothetical protein